MRKLLLIPLLFAAACDGGSGPAGSAQLTAAEAAELTRAMFGMASSLASAGLPGGLGFNAAPMEQNTFTAPIHETIPCTPSGSTDVDGTVTIGFDDVTMGMTMEAELSATPDDCAHRMENGDVIRITGDPDLDIHVRMAGNAEELTTLQVTETGAFRWTRGGTSGRCAVSIASSLNAATQRVTVSGTFCGFPVNETFPVEA
ncbi:MAG TPA: hypothetical protein VF006_05860 [Longimicrobium sp.]